MKIVTIVCLLAILAGCTSQRKSISSKPNRFTEQFQQADSAFNKQYELKMIRARFFVNKEECEGDYRPLEWPIQYPYWCTGENDSYFVLVAYINSMKN